MKYFKSIICFWVFYNNFNHYANKISGFKELAKVKYLKSNTWNKTSYEMKLSLKILNHLVKYIGVYEILLIKEFRLNSKFELKITWK